MSDTVTVQLTAIEALIVDEGLETFVAALKRDPNPDDRALVGVVRSLQDRIMRAASEQFSVVKSGDAQ